jgi:DNA-binding response OmpR family regulator
MGTPVHEEAQPLRGVRVLIVEDSWQVAKALGSVLSDLGMVVTGPTSTVAEAERLVAEQQPELALVDLNLRGEMAFGLVGWLRDRGLRVIVLTGYAGLSKPLDKANAVLQKPYDAHELLATMRQVLAAT